MDRKLRLLLFLALAMPATASAQVCTLNTAGYGWNWSCPGGQNWQRINLLSKVDDADISSAGSVCTSGANCYTQFKTKYGSTGGSWTAWETAMSTRMASLGFTGAGYYSARYDLNWASGKLPYEASANYGQYAIQDGTNGVTGTAYHVKDAGFISSATAAVMKCGANYDANLVTPDPYDPEFPTAYGALYAAGYATYTVAGMVIFQADDGDNLGVMNKVEGANAHADYGLIIASQNPVQGTSSNTAGGAHTFSNKTYFAKQGLMTWLTTKYTTVAALNAAWGTSYTTFGTSDAGGLSGITAGTYASYGSGTGFLDDDGTDLVGISCSGTDGNGPQQNQSWATNNQIQLDVDQWMAQGFAAKWAQQIWTAWAAACTTSCPPLSIPIYAGPRTPSASSVYAGMASALTGDSFVFWLAPPDISSNSAFTMIVQGILNNDGNAPVIVANYWVAQPDSFVTGSGSYYNCTGLGIDCQSTQALRGSNWTTVLSSVLHLKNPAGKYGVVGYEHWSMWDSYSQGGNFGLFTDNDNAYDGSAASTATSSGSCATSHSYTAPAVCLDSNGNYESLAVTSCTSASSGLTWSLEYGGLETDTAGCSWFNDGSYTRNVESSNFGNSLLPIVNENENILTYDLSANTAGNGILVK